MGEIVSFIFSSLSIVSVIGIGVWVGVMNTKVSRLGDISKDIKELTKVVYEMKGQLEARR
jgi:hypothetical protein